MLRDFYKWRDKVTSVACVIIYATYRLATINPLLSGTARNGTAYSVKILNHHFAERNTKFQYKSNLERDTWTFS